VFHQAVGLDCNGLSEQSLGSLGRIAAQVTLTDFGPNDHPGAGGAEAF